MSDDARTRHESSVLEHFFGVLVDPMTYKRLGFLLAAFPLGILYFVALVTGGALGLSLSVVWVGLPILLAVLLMSYAFSTLERSLANGLLDANISPAERASRPEGLVKKLVTLVSHPTTWKGLSYQLLKFPLGIISFILVVTFVSVSVAFIAAPLLILIPGLNPDPIRLWWETGLNPMTEAAILSVMGVLLLPISLHVLNGFAWMQGEIARAMLGSESAAFRE